MKNILEELYMLLDLYFRIELQGGIIEASDHLTIVEPVLERRVLQEDILGKILEKSQELHAL